MKYPRLLRRRNRRRAQAIGSQALSSLSNVVAALLVARSFDTPEPFGAFGLAMVAYQLMVGLTRALIGEPFLSLYSGTTTSTRSRAMSEGLAFTVVIALAGSSIIATVGSVVGGMSGQALSGLSVVLPLTLLHDAYRYYCVVDRAGTALLIDAVWLVGVIIGFQLIPNDAGISWYITIWGLAAGLGLIVSFLSVPGLLRYTSPWSWIRTHIAACRNTFGEYLTVGATNHVMVMLLAPLGGLATVSALRASQVFYGPHFTLHGGIYLAVVPDAARLRKDSARMTRLLVLCSLFLTLLVLGWMLIGLLLPRPWGATLLGGSWEGARQLMMPFGIGMMATALSTGGRLGIRSLGDLHQSFITRLHVTPWQLLLPLAGAMWWGVYGLGVGFAVGRVITAVLWWKGFVHSLHKHRYSESGDVVLDGEISSSALADTTRE